MAAAGAGGGASGVSTGAGMGGAVGAPAADVSVIVGGVVVVGDGRGRRGSRSCQSCSYMVDQPMMHGARGAVGALGSPRGRDIGMT